MGENVVKMNSEIQEKETKKLSYEELQSVAAQLSTQNQQIVAKYKELAAQHQELLQNNYFVRLEWLWRVIHSDKFNKDFVLKCSEEFISMMTPEENKE